MENTRTIHELRQRIADYRRMRGMTMDKQALRAIDSIIEETEEELKQREHALATC